MGCGGGGGRSALFVLFFTRSAAARAGILRAAAAAAAADLILFSAVIQHPPPPLTQPPAPSPPHCPVAAACPSLPLHHPWPCAQGASLTAAAGPPAPLLPRASIGLAPRAGTGDLLHGHHPTAGDGLSCPALQASLHNNRGEGGARGRGRGGGGQQRGGGASFEASSRGAAQCPGGAIARALLHSHLCCIPVAAGTGGGAAGIGLAWPGSTAGACSRGGCSPSSGSTAGGGQLGGSWGGRGCPAAALVLWSPAWSSGAGS
ncbi:hypothetical protein V8C86DRAFT_1324212 [Haematococcus lacustris]